MATWQQLSNRQQNILAELALEIAVIAYFINKIMGLNDDTAWGSAELGWIIGKTVVLAIIGAIIMMVVINRRGEEPADERDHRIAARAHKVAYLSLYVGVCLVIALITNSHIADNYLFGGPSYLSAQGIEMNYMQILVALLATLTCSSVIKSVTQLYLYQWGRV
ncbi:MAG TPA: hypothetical protein VIC26_06930 [Marinagarivorans sp.]